MAFADSVSSDLYFPADCHQERDSKYSGSPGTADEAWNDGLESWRIGLFGLAPRMFESGQMKRHGRISKEGSSLVRKLLIEISWLGLRYNPWMRELFCRICAENKCRKGIAIVAVARRLAVWVWAMLRDNSCWKMPECVSSEKGKVTAA